MVADLCALLFLVGLAGRGRRPWLGAVMAVHLGGGTIGILCGVALVLGHGSTALLLGGALLAALIAALLGGRRVALAAALAAVFVEVTTYACFVFVLWFQSLLPH